MARLAGKRGSISLGGTTLHVTEWSANVEPELIDSTNTGDDANRTYISGLVGGSLSFTIIYDDENLVDAGAGVGLWRGAQAAFVGNIGNAVDTISGNCRLESIEISSSVDGRVEVSCSGKFDGAITQPS